MKFGKINLGFLVLWMLGTAVAQTSLPAAPAPLSFQEKFQIYFKKTYKPSGFLVPALMSGINQATDSPHEWGQAGDGFIKRWGTARGQLQFYELARFGVGALTHEDPRLLASNKHGSWARMKYVIGQTVLAHTDSGDQQPAYGVFAGALAAGFVPQFWLPASQASTAKACERSAMFVGLTVGMNMGVEFGPDDRRFARRTLRKIFHR